MGIQYFNHGGSTTQNIGCPSIMTPSKMGKIKNCIFYFLTDLWLPVLCGVSIPMKFLDYRQHITQSSHLTGCSRPVRLSRILPIPIPTSVSNEDQWMILKLVLLISFCMFYISKLNFITNLLTFLTVHHKPPVMLASISWTKYYLLYHKKANKVFQ